MESHRQFAADNADLDRAFLKRDVGEFVRLAAARAHKELDDGIQRAESIDMAGKGGEKLDGSSDGT